MQQRQKKRKTGEGGGQKKTREPRPRAHQAGEHKNLETAGEQPTRSGKKNNKMERKNKSTQQGYTQPGGGRAKQREKTAKEKVRRTKTRPGARPARPGQKERAHAHTHVTWAWRPPGRCQRPHETALVHRPSPPSNDRGYGKPDKSVIGSTHAKPPQRTQPKTESRGTRQEQRHCGAPNGYDTERAQRPCLCRGQRQAQ